MASTGRGEANMRTADMEVMDNTSDFEFVFHFLVLSSVRES